MKMRSLLRALPLAAGMLLTACAGSPPVRYHSLQNTLSLESLGAPRDQALPFQIEVLPVNMAAQADHPQLMVRGADGAVTPWYSERWTASLAEELQAALSDTLSTMLGVVDVQTIRPAAGAPLWRIQTDVRRFELQPGVQALLELTWRVLPVNTPGVGLLCRTTVRVSTSGVDALALVDAQQQAVHLLGMTLALALRAGGQGAQAAAPQVEVQACQEIKS